MKKTLFKVIVYIFCVFSIIELCAEEGMDDLEKKNFFKIERLEAEIIELKDQYKLLAEEQAINIQEQSESKGGLDLEVAFFKLNAKVNSLNDDILTASTLKDQYELLKEEQRLNTQKITELFDMLELKFTKEAVKEVALDDKENEKKAFQIYADGRNQFVAGEYDDAIALFKSYLDSFPNYKNVADAKLWLGRTYFANELYSQSKAIYLEFQSENLQHAKYPDSMYELSRARFELGELDAAKKLLTKMIEKFPTHDLYKKAKQMLTELEELTIDA